MNAQLSGVLLDVLFLGAPLLLACASVATIRRSSGASGALSMRVGLAAVGVGTTFHHPGVRDAVTAALGAPLMSTAYHAAFLIVGICVLDVLAAGLGRSERRRRRQLMIGVAALMLLALPWVLDPPGPHGTSALYGPDFFNDGWQTAAHAGVLVTFLGWAEISLLRHCLSRGLPIARTAVGVSLLLIAATAALALVCLGTAAITSALWSIGLGGAISADLYNAMTAGSMGLATLFVAAGAAWAPLASAWGRWRGDRERRRRVDVLLPHWQDLREVLADHSPFTPGIREAPRSPEQAKLQELLLFGEIREAHWRLYGLVTQDEVEAFLNEAETLGLSALDVMAYADQCCLHLGLQRWRAGQRAVRGRRTQPTAPTTHRALVEHLLRGSQIQRRLATAHGEKR